MSRLVRKGAHVTSPLGPAKSGRGVSAAHPQRGFWKERGTLKTRTAHGDGGEGSGRVSHSAVMCVVYSRVWCAYGRPSARSGSFWSWTAPVWPTSFVLSCFHFLLWKTSNTWKTPMDPTRISPFCQSFLVMTFF